MTTTLTIRLPARLARELKAKAKGANTSPTAVLREAAAKYVAEMPSKSGLNAMQQHIVKYAGRWEGDISGEELLRKTRA